MLTITYGGELLYLPIWRDHSALSAYIIVTAWFTVRLPICAHDFNPHGKGNSHLTKLLGGLSYEKIRRYNNSLPYVTARWPPQQISPVDFLGLVQEYYLLWGNKPYDSSIWTNFGLFIFITVIETFQSWMKRSRWPRKLCFCNPRTLKRYLLISILNHVMFSAYSPEVLAISYIMYTQVYAVLRNYILLFIWIFKFYLKNVWNHVIKCQHQFPFRLLGSTAFSGQMLL